MRQKRRQLALVGFMLFLAGLTTAILVKSIHIGRSVSPDFSAIEDSDERKRKFFAFIRKELESINAEIAADRTLLESLRKETAAGHRLGDDKLPELERIITRYGLTGLDPREDSDWSFLLLHVDQLPVSLVLAQAANESAWGASVFAREANNFFGQRCFEPGCGLQPIDREPGRVYELRRFSSARESVEAYVHEINTSEAYFDFRVLRARLRSEGKPLLGSALVEAFTTYSRSRKSQVRQLKSVVRTYHYEVFGKEEGL